MIRECHELTAVLVHVMLDRARVFKSSELLDEKDGVAGPARRRPRPRAEQPGVGRGAQRQDARGPARRRSDDATQRFCALEPFGGAERTRLPRLRDERVPARSRPRARSSSRIRQDAIDDWLAAHDVRGRGRGAAGARPVSSPPTSTASAPRSAPDKVGAVLAHEATAAGGRQLAAEIDTAATRIHSLVAAVKGFTYVNQQATPLPIAIGQGLSDTITVLRSKATAEVGRDRSAGRPSSCPPSRATAAS